MVFPISPFQNSVEMRIPWYQAANVIDKERNEKRSLDRWVREGIPFHDPVLQKDVVFLLPQQLLVWSSFAVGVLSQPTFSSIGDSPTPPFCDRCKTVRKKNTEKTKVWFLNARDPRTEPRRTDPTHPSRPPRHRRRPFPVHFRASASESALS